MAHWVKFLIQVPFMTAGLVAVMMMPFWAGVLSAIALLIVGSVIATFVFKRIATPEQIKEELQARLHND